MVNAVQSDTEELHKSRRCKKLVEPSKTDFMMSTSLEFQLTEEQDTTVHEVKDSGE